MLQKVYQSFSKLFVFVRYLFYISFFVVVCFLITLYFYPQGGYYVLAQIDSLILKITQNDIIENDSIFESMEQNSTNSLDLELYKQYKQYDEQFKQSDNQLSEISDKTVSKGEVSDTKASDAEIGLDKTKQNETEIIVDVTTKQNISKLYKNFEFQKINGKLEIPSINVAGKIISGKDEHIMEKGFWHVNINGAWLEYGNIVIFGHRFYHLPPAKDTFFNLDKVKKGDTVVIKTDLGNWFYQVYDIQVVSKYDKSIFKNTDIPQLTLVTCHPLWSSSQRLVVKAKLQTSIFNSKW